MKRAVITGMGVVSPFGPGWNAWGDGLRRATSATRVIQSFDAFHPRGRRDEAPLPSRVAAEVLNFDPRNHLDPRDLDRVPRVVPLALAASREALHSAGFENMTAEQKRDFDVVLGSGGGGISFAEEQISHWLSGDKNPSPFAVSSSIAGMVSSEISIAFGLRGRSHTLSNGCTSSTDALGNALDLVRSGRAKTILCGGADAPITPAFMAGFCQMRAVSTNYNEQPERASRPFDRDRDGFVLGEGAWIFVVEEREHARARGAKMWAEITGYGATCEAFHRVALNEPHEAARAMQMALCDANTHAEQIDYVNLHGTATAMNDPLESDAVKLALRNNAYQTPMSSTKSQIGHPQGASGAAGVAATIFAMHESVLPATINLENPDERCNLDYVAQRPRAANVEFALCNCLGFGSKNSALVLKNCD